MFGAAGGAATQNDADAKRAEEKARAERARGSSPVPRVSGRDEATRRRDARAYRRWLWRTAQDPSWLRGWGRMRRRR